MLTLFAAFVIAIAPTEPPAPVGVPDDPFVASCAFTYDPPPLCPVDVSGFELLYGEGWIDAFPTPAVAVESTPFPAFAGSLSAPEFDAALRHADDARG